MINWCKLLISTPPGAPRPGGGGLKSCKPSDLGKLADWIGSSFSAVTAKLEPSTINAKAQRLIYLCALCTIWL